MDSLLIQALIELTGRSEKWWKQNYERVRECGLRPIRQSVNKVASRQSIPDEGLLCVECIKTGKHIEAIGTYGNQHMPLCEKCKYSLNYGTDDETDEED